MSKAVNVRRAAREQAGVSVAMAAKACRVKPSTFLRYESINAFPFHRALALSILYNCGIETFL